MALYEKKRGQPRKDVFIPTKVRKADADIYEKARVKDISIGGVRLETEASFFKGDLIEFIVDDDSYDEHYLATAEVKWVGRPTAHHDGDIYDGVTVNRYGIEILKKEYLRPPGGKPRE